MIWEKDTCSFPDKTRYAQCFEYMFIFSKGKPKSFRPIKDRKNKYAGYKQHGTYRAADGTIRKRGEKWAGKAVEEYGARFNVWQQPTEKKNKSGHPAVFPYQLAADHIESWSEQGDTVLDPFLGSGTTGAAAIDKKRNFIGFEISKDYFTYAKERIEERELQSSFI